MKLTPALLTMVMLGLVGLLVVGYVAKRMFAQEEVAPEPSTVNVPMALTDLEPGTVITEAHIGLGPALKSKLDREVLKSERVIVGRVVKNPIERAQPLRTSDLYAIGERPPLKLSPGMRAVSVGLSDGNSLVDGLIQPDQFVDVLFTPATVENMRGGMVMNLFKGVKVLAINRNQTATPSLAQGSNSVTLELTPEQANILVLARGKGDINLTYNPNGQGDGGVAVGNENRAYLDEVLGLAPPQEPEPPFVTEIFVGSGRQANTFGTGGQVSREGHQPPHVIQNGSQGQAIEIPDANAGPSPNNTTFNNTGA